MPKVQSKKSIEQVAKYADMFSAMGTESRLRIMQLLLSAHPEGSVVGEIQEELDIPNSTLSHHLDKLRNEDLVSVRRESTFLHYTANTEALQELLRFLYAECCTRNKAVRPEQIVQIVITGEHMGDANIKEVVKEKYGEAALRVTSGGSSCCGAAPQLATAAVIQSHPIFTMSCRSGSDSGRGAAGVAGLRQSDRFGST